MLRSVRFLSLALFLVGAFAVSVASAQILNSERIEQTFGSYGISVLYSDEMLRLSNLYSEHEGEMVTRTLAVVEYPEISNVAFAAEHQVITSGGSIGSTFTEAGWEVIKRNLSIFEFSAPEEFSGPMGVDASAKIATHFYQLDIEKNGQRYAYASIVEMHHPDYLSKADLSSIYPIDIVPDSRQSLRRHLQLIESGFGILQLPRLPLIQ